MGGGGGREWSGPGMEVAEGRPGVAGFNVPASPGGATRCGVSGASKCGSLSRLAVPPAGRTVSGSTSGLGGSPGGPIPGTSGRPPESGWPDRPVAPGSPGAAPEGPGGGPKGTHEASDGGPPLGPAGGGPGAEPKRSCSSEAGAGRSPSRAPCPPGLTGPAVGTCRRPESRPTSRSESSVPGAGWDPDGERGGEAEKRSESRSGGREGSSVMPGLRLTVASSGIVLGGGGRPGGGENGRRESGGTRLASCSGSSVTTSRGAAPWGPVFVSRLTAAPSV